MSISGDFSFSSMINQEQFSRTHKCALRKKRQIEITSESLEINKCKKIDMQHNILVTETKLSINTHRIGIYHLLSLNKTSKHIEYWWCDVALKRFENIFEK